MRPAWLLLLMPALGCGTSAPPAPIFLGHVATVSGAERALGEQETLGLRLAIEDLAKDGDERLSKPVHVRHTDARGQLDDFKGQAVRLAVVSRVVAIFGGNSAAEVLKLDRGAERGQVPLVTPLGWRPRGLSDLTFCVGMAPAGQGQALARYAVEEVGLRRMAVLLDERGVETQAEDRREYFQTLADAFDREWRHLSVDNAKTLAEKPMVVPFGKDAKFAELARRLEKAQVAAVLFAGTARDFADFRKSIKDPKCLLFFGGPDGSLKPDSQAGGAVFLATAFAQDPEIPATVEFVKRFRAAFKEDPDVHAALAYEGARLVVDALRRARTPFSDRLLAELRDTKDFSGLTGPLTFVPDQVLRRPIFVGKLENGVWALLKRYPPSQP